MVSALKLEDLFYLLYNFSFKNKELRLIELICLDILLFVNVVLFINKMYLFCYKGALPPTQLLIYSNTHVLKYSCTQILMYSNTHLLKH